MFRSSWIARVVNVVVPVVLGVFLFVWLNAPRRNEPLLHPGVERGARGASAAQAHAPPASRAPEAPAPLAEAPSEPESAVVEDVARSLPGVGSAPRRRSDYGLRGELNLALERYRRAANAEERSAPLMQLALSDRPEVFPFLMDELRRGQAEDRPAVVEALIQYGNREAIPALRELAEASPDPDERRSLGEAADYLALPSYAEVYLRKTKPAAVVETP